MKKPGEIKIPESARTSVEKKEIGSETTVCALHLGITQETLNLLLKYPYTHQKFHELFLDTEDAWFTLNNIWIKVRKMGESFYQNSVKICSSQDEPQIELLYKERNVPLNLLKKCLSDIRKNRGVYDDFDLHPFATFEVDRLAFKLNKLTLRVDITKFKEADYYMIGSIQAENDTAIYSQLSEIPQVYGTMFAPVRSKVLEYMKSYQPEMYEELNLHNQWISNEGVNRFYEMPIPFEPIDEQTEIKKFQQLLGIDDLSVFVKDAEEQGMTVLQCLKQSYRIAVLTLRPASPNHPSFHEMRQQLLKTTDMIN